ncbi:MAG: DUF2914 domain-containing protein [Pseudomonadota bacterium]
MKKITLCSMFVSVAVLAGCAKPAATPASAGTQKETKTAKELSKPQTKPAPTKGGIFLIDAVACRSVENRVPVGVADRFLPDGGRIYVFTKVGLDASKEGSIKHVWRFGGREVASLKLLVKGPQWRTYSSKLIDGSHKGDWVVDVMTDQGELLKSVPFKVE